MYTNRPILTNETPGKKGYCTCGESATKPYCDGAHAMANNGKKPAFAQINESKKVLICDCGKSSGMPFCDGAHNK